MDQYKQAIDDLTHLKTRLDQLQIWKNPQLHTQIKTIKQSIDQIAEIVEKEQQNEKEYQKMILQGQRNKFQDSDCENDDLLNIIQKLSASGNQINQNQANQQVYQNRFYSKIQRPLQKNLQNDDTHQDAKDQQFLQQQYVSQEFLDAQNEVNKEDSNINQMEMNKYLNQQKLKQQNNFQEEFYQDEQQNKIAVKQQKLNEKKQLIQQKTPDKIKFQAFQVYQYNLDFQTKQKIQEAIQRYQMAVLQQPVFSDKGDQEVCPICYENYFQESENQEEISVSLQCKHHYHWGCLQPLLKDEYLKCPVCNKIYGIIQGDQPDGTMEVKVIKQRCSGYKCDTIQIQYNFRNGVRNGTNYTGTNRVAYLPNNNEGQFVLSLLRRAFEQKLVFTIGTSITTGQQNCTVWNGIHHKTSMNGGAANYGYPDPTYIDRVIDELKQRGIR